MASKKKNNHDSTKKRLKETLDSPLSFLLFLRDMFKLQKGISFFFFI